MKTERQTEVLASFLVMSRLMSHTFSVIPTRWRRCLDESNIKLEQEISAKLTNQRVSYAFTSSAYSFHARHILPTSKFQHSYFTFFYISEQHV